jgi:hypothetical protein
MPGPSSRYDPRPEQSETDAAGTLERAEQVTVRERETSLGEFRNSAKTRARDESRHTPCSAMGMAEVESSGFATKPLTCRHVIRRRQEPLWDFLSQYRGEY